MSIVAQTKATLTVHFVKRTGILKFISPIKTICIRHRIESLIPNLYAPVEAAFVFHPWLGWIALCEFTQWKKSNPGSQEHVFENLKQTDTTLRKDWLTTFGGKSADGTTLTPARAIGRLIGLPKWKECTYKSLGLLD